MVVGLTTDALTAVKKGVTFLEDAQLPSGQFPMEMCIREGWKESGELGTPFAERSVFSTAFIVQSLAFCREARTDAMIARALSFLESEAFHGGLWRYWCKGTPLFSQVPLDVDDTACISETLVKFGRPVASNREVLLANRNDAGLFYTWLTPRLEFVKSLRWWWAVISDLSYRRIFEFWHAGARRGDVDSVVNANVILYLGDSAQTVAVTEWLMGIAAKGLEEETDRWYRSRPAFYFALSRCYAAGHRNLDGAKDSLQRAFASLSGSSGCIGGDALQTSLALCAIDNFRLSMDERMSSIRYLIDAQRSDGGWDWCPFYYDGRKVPLIFLGSRSTTTAFCIEALMRFGART